MNWKNKLKIKHLFTQNEDPDSVDQSMRAIADIIKTKPFMAGFDYQDFYNMLDDADPLSFANQSVNFFSIVGAFQDKQLKIA